VLKAALCSRGLTAFAAQEARAGLRLIRDHDPAVVVLDGETSGADDGALQAELQSQLVGRPTALIVLGRLRGQRLLPRQVVAKPYHFAPLIHTIEELAARAA
jgi:DNA-binding response OmpR family regulator